MNAGFPPPPEQTQDDSRSFTRRKFEWLDAVASDPELPPIAARLAIIIANRYLNSISAEAWPGVETLARALDVSANTVRTGMRALSRRHMRAEISTGGKGQTNRYTPTIDGKPLRNLKGSESPNPSKSSGETLQNQSAKPFKNLEGNPLEGNPLNEPLAGIKPAYRSSTSSASQNRGSSSLADSSRRSPFKVEDEILWNDRRYDITAITGAVAAIRCVWTGREHENVPLAEFTRAPPRSCSDLDDEIP